KEDDAETEENREEGTLRIGDHPLQYDQARGVADQLEGPNKGEEAGDLGAEHNGERSGHGADEIANPTHRTCPGQPRAPRTAQLASGGSRCSSQSKEIFAGKKSANDPEPGVERVGQSRSPSSLGVGYHDADPRRQHCVMDGAKDAGEARSLGIKKPIEAVA